MTASSSAAAVHKATDAESATPIRQGIRLQSIDVLRGLVIIFMVLDHVRDFFHVSAFAFDPLDVDKSNVILYVTRWVTHFCAPTFVFLAGTSSWLQLERGKSKKDLAWFLFSRGLWLVILEFTVINFAWNFQIGWPFLQVIWVIGLSMMLMAALVWLPAAAILALGVLIVAGHNALDPLNAMQGTPAADLWTFAHHPGMLPLPGGGQILELYPFLPWFGVFCLGFGLGRMFIAEPAQRRRVNFVILGLAMIGVFIVLRMFNGYGDPQHWVARGTFIQTLGNFMNVLKYPPSLLYVLITLGPVLALMPVWEKLKGWPAEIALTYGRVPLFAYVLHLFIAHGIMLGVGLATGHQLSEFQGVATNPGVLHNWGHPLWVVYLVWLITLAILFPLCRWFGKVKRERRDWWLSYL